MRRRLHAKNNHVKNYKYTFRVIFSMRSLNEVHEKAVDRVMEQLSTQDTTIVRISGSIPRPDLLEINWKTHELIAVEVQRVQGASAKRRFYRQHIHFSPYSALRLFIFHTTLRKGLRDVKQVLLASRAQLEREQETGLMKQMLDLR